MAQVLMLGLPIDKLKNHFKRFSACCPSPVILPPSVTVSSIMSVILRPLIGGMVTGIASIKNLWYKFFAIH